jgi:hypothetical protein
VGLFYLYLFKLKTMPDKRPNESREDFLTRCMGDSEMNSEFPDNEQRYAVCITKAKLKEEYYAQESYNDYPDSVSNNAKRGIELNEAVNNKCATQVGKVRAQQLANKEKVSIDTIQRMYSYLSRAEVYYNENDTKACGTISYLLWGGKSGLSWSRSKLKELDLLNE